jgi:hypothetical protein
LLVLLYKILDCKNNIFKHKAKSQMSKIKTGELLKIEVQNKKPAFFT